MVELQNKIFLKNNEQSLEKRVENLGCEISSLGSLCTQSSVEMKLNGNYVLESGNQKVNLEIDLATNSGNGVLAYKINGDKNLANKVENYLNFGRLEKDEFWNLS